MFIVNWEEFASLPENILYCKIDEGGNMGGVYKKGSTIVSSGSKPVDFYNESVAGEVDAVDSEEADNIVMDAISTGDSFSLVSRQGRDGCFDVKQLFGIYEKDDLAVIAGVIGGAVT